MVVFILIVLSSLIAFLFLFVRRLVHFVLLFFCQLLVLSVIYFIMNAQLAAVSQIIVYVGGILLLMMFGIMLTHSTANGIQSVNRKLVIPAFVSGVIIFFSLYTIFVNGKGFMHQVSKTGKGFPLVLNQVEATGYLFFTEFLILFELLSVFLLLALIGAAKLSNFKGKKYV